MPKINRSNTRKVAKLARVLASLEQARVAPPGPGRVAAGTTLVSQRGFNWGDAGVGAGTALLAAAAGGCALAIRRRVSLAH